jgi:hypothetical protein
MQHVRAWARGERERASRRPYLRSNIATVGGVFVVMYLELFTASFDSLKIASFSSLHFFFTPKTYKN